jgi:FtsH-binding integral membrane protein
MSWSNQTYGSSFAYAAPLDARLEFVKRTYLHLAGAILAFVVLSWVFQVTGTGVMMLQLLGQSRLGWLLMLGGFTVAGWIATNMAQSAGSREAQYAGLGLYTLAEALIFAPLLAIASRMPGVLPTAAGITLLAFGGLSFYALTTRTDFSFLRGALCVGGWIALGAIVLGAIFGFSLGIWFSVAMLVFASGAVLYQTSSILHEYRTDQYVGASLALFASVALMFWYVVRLLMQLQRR